MQKAAEATYERAHGGHDHALLITQRKAELKAIQQQSMSVLVNQRFSAAKTIFHRPSRQLVPKPTGRLLRSLERLAQPRGLGLEEDEEEWKEDRPSDRSRASALPRQRQEMLKATMKTRRKMQMERRLHDGSYTRSSHQIVPQQDTEIAVLDVAESPTCQEEEAVMVEGSEQGEEEEVFASGEATNNNKKLSKQCRMTMEEDFQGMGGDETELKMGSGTMSQDAGSASMSRGLGHGEEDTREDLLEQRRTELAGDVAALRGNRCV